MDQIENLTYAVVGKFSYGGLLIEELWKIIPIQCGLKGGCKVGFFCYRHVMTHYANNEDFVNICQSVLIIWSLKDGNTYKMRTLIYNSWFKVDVETTQVLTRISFPSFLPTFFAKETLFSLASIVAEPLQIDMATMNRTCPSCARVKGPSRPCSKPSKFIH